MWVKWRGEMHREVTLLSVRRDVWECQGRAKEEKREGALNEGDDERKVGPWSVWEGEKEEIEGGGCVCVHYWPQPLWLHPSILLSGDCVLSCLNACLNASLCECYNHVAYARSLQCMCVCVCLWLFLCVSVHQHMCCMASPYITSCEGSTVWGLEGLPRLPSQHREQSKAFFNPAECTSHIWLPACIGISFLCCSLFLSLSLSLPLSYSFFITTLPLCHFSGSSRGVSSVVAPHAMCVHMLLLSSYSALAYSLLLLCALSLFPGCTFHEDDFSIKCPRHEVR